MKQSIESRSQAYKRITDGLRQFINHSVGAMKLVQEAKRLEIWKEKWSSWQEYCEKEFGKSRQRVYELLQVAGTIDEIKSVCLADIESAKNKEILDNLNRRQAAALNGLPPVQKAEVFAKAIEAEGGKSPKPDTIATARKDIGEREDFYFDRLPATTAADTALAKDFSRAYPKTLTIEVLSESEEDQVRRFVETLVASRGGNGHVPTTRDLIQALCDAHKDVTGKKLIVTGPDAGQCRRLLEAAGSDGIPEIVDVYRKSLKSDGFFARQSHQITTFIKHYGNIRHEITNPHRGGNGKGNPRLEGVCRNDAINDYGKLAAAKCKMDAERAQAAMRQFSGTEAS